MEKELIYMIGEALMLEVEFIDNICYPNCEQDTFLVTTKSGKHYSLSLRLLGEGKEPSVI